MNMKTIILDEQIKNLYPYHEFTDKYDYKLKQFDYWDMLDFAKKMCNQTVELCKENIIDKTLNSLESDTILTREQIKSIENTKNKIV